MTYRMFLDDERDPPRTGEWIVVRSYEEAVQVVRVLGFPTYVSFDHDLGPGKTGMDVARYLVDYALSEEEDLSDFGFYVHSQNPIGRDNINGLLNSFLEYYERMKDEPDQGGASQGAA